MQEASGWMPFTPKTGCQVSLCSNEAGQQIDGFASESFLAGAAPIFKDLGVGIGDLIGVWQLYHKVLLVRALRHGMS